jgi:hypothetical protein
MTDPQFQAETESYLNLNPNPNLHFIWVGLPPRWDPRRTPGSDKGSDYTIFSGNGPYCAKQATTPEAQLRLVHHLSWGTISAPPHVWRLRIPFVWGPVGGGQKTAAFRRYFGLRWTRETPHFASEDGHVHTEPAADRAGKRADSLTNPETTPALKAAGYEVRFFPTSACRTVMGYTPETRLLTGRN